VGGAGFELARGFNGTGNNRTQEPDQCQPPFQPFPASQGGVESSIPPRRELPFERARSSSSALGSLPQPTYVDTDGSGKGNGNGKSKPSSKTKGGNQECPTCSASRQFSDGALLGHDVEKALAQLLGTDRVGGSAAERAGADCGTGTQDSMLSAATCRLIQEAVAGLLMQESFLQLCEVVETAWMGRGTAGGAQAPPRAT